MASAEFQLKTLAKEAIPAAIKRAEHYRLLNESSPAESICLDVLEVEPENQQVLVTLLLALTDQFDHYTSGLFKKACEVLPRIHDEYSRAYYEGIIWERRAKAQAQRANPGSGHSAYDSYIRAMECFEKALPIRPPGNDDAILRWNNCARTIMRKRELRPAPEDAFTTWLE
ncbi:MAG: hypothetical protein V3V56_04940 [bacterium]